MLVETILRPNPPQYSRLLKEKTVSIIQIKNRTTYLAPTCINVSPLHVKTHSLACIQTSFKKETHKNTSFLSYTCVFTPMAFVYVSEPHLKLRLNTLSNR
jgi:hypothetical protein